VLHVLQAQEEEEPTGSTSAQNGAGRADARLSSAAATPPAASRKSDEKDMSSVMQLLQNLSQLSNELQKDAEEDDEIFREGGSD
jgi:hypothetical protein